MIVSAPSEPDPPTRLLLLGWNRRAPLVVGQLLRTARSGSVLDVITDSAVPGPRQPEAEGVTTSGGVRFRSAALSRPETLLGLDLSPYDGLVVLGPDQGEGPDRPDDWTLVTLLALRLLEERTGHEVSLVTELVEDRNRPLASVNRGSDVIVSGKLTGLLMAQIAQNRYLAPVFDELFSAEGAGCVPTTRRKVRPSGRRGHVRHPRRRCTRPGRMRDRLHQPRGAHRAHHRWGPAQPAEGRTACLELRGPPGGAGDGSWCCLRTRRPGRLHHVRRSVKADVPVVRA